MLVMTVPTIFEVILSNNQKPKVKIFDFLKIESTLIKLVLPI